MPVPVPVPVPVRITVPTAASVSAPLPPSHAPDTAPVPSPTRPVSRRDTARSCGSHLMATTASCALLLCSSSNKRCTSSNTKMHTLFFTSLKTRSTFLYVSEAYFAKSSETFTILSARPHSYPMAEATVLWEEREEWGRAIRPSHCRRCSQTQNLRVQNYPGGGVGGSVIPQ